MTPRSTSYPDDALVALGPGAALIGVSRPTLRTYADDGRLPVYRTPTGQRRFRVSDLRALLTTEEQPANPAAAAETHQAAS